MKRILSVALAVLMLVGIMCVAPVSASAEDTQLITVYFENNWLWSDVFYHSWGSALDTNTAWGEGAPELVGTSVDGYEVYKTVIGSDSAGVLFAGTKDDGSGQIDKTPDIIDFYDGACYSMLWNNGNTVVLDDIENVCPDLFDDSSDTPADGYTVNFVDWSSGFEKFYVYAWNGEGEDAVAAAPWPGLEMTPNGEMTVEGDLVYSYTFDTEYEYVIFNDGADIKTVDLEFATGQYLWWGNDSWYESVDAVNDVLNGLSGGGESSDDEPGDVPDDDEIYEDFVTIYFYNVRNWPDAKIYYWGSETVENTSWPGVSMDFYAIEDEYRHETYSFNLPADVDGFLFTGTDNETGLLDKSPDITEGFYEGICYKVMYNWEIGNVIGFNDISEYRFEGIHDLDPDYDMIYFQNVYDWTDVRFYFQGSQIEDLNGVRVPMEYFGYYGGHDVYRYYMPADVDGFNFSGYDENGVYKDTYLVEGGFIDDVCYYAVELPDDIYCGRYENISEIMPDSPDDDVPEECEHSFNSNGVCIKCGELEEGVVAGVAGYKLSLGGNIGVMQYVAVSEEVVNDENAKFVITVPDTGSTYDVEIPINEAEFDGTYFVVTSEVAAKEIASDIALKLVTSEGEVDLGTFSVKQYCEYTINGAASTEELKAVAKALLNYGAASQIYFDYNTDNLANDTECMTAEDKVIATADLSAYAPVVEGEPDEVSYYGAALSLKSETALKFYFKVENPVSDSMAITVNGIHGAPIVKNGTLYEFKISNIAAHMLGEEYVLETGGQTITYSALSYAYLAQQSQNPALVNVANALCAYADAVSIYA